MSRPYRILVTGSREWHAHSVVSRVAYVEAGYALCVPGGLVVPT